MMQKLSDWLKANNWHFEINKEIDFQSDIEVLKEYKNIPQEFLDFLKFYKSVLSKDEKTWFLCLDEYNDNSEYAYKWNEFELISLDAASGDEDWENEIKNWWKNKLPIIMSVKDSYSFYAIDMLNNNCIVKGEEPEFEETTVIANSFVEFLTMLETGKLGL